MKTRLVILSEIISPYRIPVFNALAHLPAIDLHVIFLAETDSSMRQWRVYTNEIRFSYEVLPSWRRRLGKHNILLNRNVAVALSQAMPDVVLCGGYNYVASWQALRWARKNAVPFLLWCESTQSDRRRQLWLVEEAKQNFIRHCSGFVVPGRSAFEYVQRISDSQPIFVAPNAVDTHLFSTRSDVARARAERLRGELGLPARYFLYVGRLVRTKGVFDLLEAYGALDADLRSNVGLVFVGNGPLRAVLESMAHSIFPGTVYVTGFVHREELPSYYSLAECLVLPTHSDPWGLVVNEAMACGSPVICSSVAGCAADLVKSNGWIVEPKNVPQLSRAMRDMASDYRLRKYMSSESRRLIRDYSPERCAEGIAKGALAAGVDRNSDHSVSSRDSAMAAGL